ncbi:FAD-dependent oxidoreductase [Fodinicola acaciae]|uniref:FAD-dependent oxidoreductase n=1 Tax=Fodinicola acaciae TaxID=2681555 RepID=UPI0013D2D417|nr:FAD-dependent oxidoreductase [Fodinicola acaciae]
MTKNEARIAIVGGGLGGLACARVLQNHGMDVTVFEQEPSPDGRSQGGTLDMHSDTGQVALRTAGLYDEFRRLSRPEGQQWRLLDHRTAAVLTDVPAEGEDRPEIDRGDLRGLFLDALKPDTVQWGRGIESVAELDAFDLVVGADGAWSKVRAAITGAKPVYSGVTFIETHFDRIDERHPMIAAMIGNGTMLAKGPRKAVFAQRNSNGHVRTYVALRGDQSHLDFADTAAIRAYLSETYEGWHENLRALFIHNDGGFIHRPIHALPVPHVWQHKPGLTLVGDAAHLMAPLGVGANLALLDGTELATALATEPTIDEAVRAYEAVMLPRSVQTAKEVHEGLETLMP